MPSSKSNDKYVVCHLFAPHLSASRYFHARPQLSIYLIVAECLPVIKRSVTHCTIRLRVHIGRRNEKRIKPECIHSIHSNSGNNWFLCRNALTEPTFTRKYQYILCIQSIYAVSIDDAGLLCYIYVFIFNFSERPIYLSINLLIFKCKYLLTVL